MDLRSLICPLEQRIIQYKRGRPSVILHQSGLDKIGGMKTMLVFNFLAFAAANTISQLETNIGCYVDGECLNSASIGFYASNGTSSCFDFCQTTAGCNYFTNYIGDSICFAFEDCVDFSNEGCSDCTSGESVCPSLECDQRNECVGSSLGVDVLNSVESCAQFCLGTENCGWWTYDSSNGVCDLFQDCSATEECTTCTSGQRKCYDGDYQGPSKPEFVSY